MHTECLPPTPGRSSWSMLSPYTVQELVSPGKQRREVQVRMRGSLRGPRLPQHTPSPGHTP